MFCIKSIRFKIPEALQVVEVEEILHVPLAMQTKNLDFTKKIRCYSAQSAMEGVLLRTEMDLIQSELFVVHELIS